jgi:excisionase family DNA binding protein
MPNNHGGDRLLSVTVVAEMLATTPKTIRRWLREGRLRGLKMASGAGASPWRVPRSEVDRLLSEAYERGGGQPIDEAPRQASSGA